LIQAGAIQVDDELEAALRKEMGLPQAGTPRLGVKDQAALDQAQAQMDQQAQQFDQQQVAQQAQKTPTGKGASGQPPKGGTQ